MKFVYRVNRRSIFRDWFAKSVPSRSIVLSDRRSIYAHVSCEGTSIPCKIEQVNQTNIWHLKFRPYLIGDYQIQLTHNDMVLTSKWTSKSSRRTVLVMDLFPADSPYIISVKDLDRKTDLSGFTNTPCIIQSENATLLLCPLHPFLLSSYQIFTECENPSSGTSRWHSNPFETVRCQSHSSSNQLLAARARLLFHQYLSRWTANRRFTIRYSNQTPSRGGNLRQMFRLFAPRWSRHLSSSLPRTERRCESKDIL